ncbi:hypothetical protein Tco_0884791, partial [Tanacetum coccineum]
MDGNRTGKSMDGNQTAKPVEKNQTCKPLKPDQTSKPVKPDQISKPVKPDQRSKTVKAGQESKPVKMDQNSKPLIKACKEVEQYLEAHSSKDLDQIGWSNFIKETMDIFKRRCEEAFRYKLSISKQDEKKVQATKPLLAIIEEYRLVADSLPIENKKE